jgi:hypothetical protein
MGDATAPDGTAGTAKRVDRPGTARRPRHGRREAATDGIRPTSPSALYVVLTTLLTDSGIVFGGMWAIAGAEEIRLRHGPGARGGLVAAYVRLVDALVPVHVETTALTAGDGVARYRVRAWLGQELLGERDLDIPFDCG